ncbi:hypothetical protein C5167_025497 [Papaver somniferum]|uniref:Uncharacterized protein n=1 Tax=Papaver somniferum TaxID=3469 RepID=A0A4Y7JUU8_PAPSO|nr:hypothetical protein C5167_025497 [Papaver somniferum]
MFTSVMSENHCFDTNLSYKNQCVLSNLTVMHGSFSAIDGCDYSSNGKDKSWLRTSPLSKPSSDIDNSDYGNAALHLHFVVIGAPQIYNSEKGVNLRSSSH